MARPKKQVVDYFPHSCTSGKTIFILEQKYKNNGYAFWFKLLERLGVTEGHFLNLEDEAEFLYLTAVTHLDEATCNDILNCLANIEAIDRDLWQSRRIIWCQNFIDGLSDLYSRRKVELPTRENAKMLKPIQLDDLSDLDKKKIWCRNVLNRSVDAGRTPKAPCRICNSTHEVQGHHYDYEIPLDVVWLCQKHHIMLHSGQLTGINVYNNPSEWDKWALDVGINPYSIVKDSIVKDSIVKEPIGNVVGEGRIDNDETLNPEDMSKKNEASKIPLPFDSIEFSEKWAEWLQYRKERKLGAYAPTGLKSTFTKLKKISQDDPSIAIEVIEQSLANGWQGLFEIKQQFNGTNIKPDSNSIKSNGTSAARIQALKNF